jgi:hypothetical protein
MLRAFRFRRVAQRLPTFLELLTHSDVDSHAIAPYRLVRYTKLKHLFIPQLSCSHAPTATLVL